MDVFPYEESENQSRRANILAQWKQMVPFLAHLCGIYTEVVLHDIQDPEHSVIAIANGHLTGRKIGSPLTDFAKECMDNKVYETTDYLSDYSGSAKGRPFLSNTIFIKDGDILIGMLCVNRDTTVCTELTEVMNRFLSGYHLNTSPSAHIQESIEQPVDEPLDRSIKTIISESGYNVRNLPPRERIYLLKLMDAHGIFSTKGSVEAVAKALYVSKPTIYRDLAHSRQHQD